MISIYELRYQKSPEEQQADVFLWVTLGGNWVLSAHSKQYARARDVLSAAGLWSNWGIRDFCEAVAVLRLAGLTVEVEE